MRSISIEEEGEGSTRSWHLEYHLARCTFTSHHNYLLICKLKRELPIDVTRVQAFESISYLVMVKTGAITSILDVKATSEAARLQLVEREPMSVPIEAHQGTQSEFT